MSSTVDPPDPRPDYIGKFTASADDFKNSTKEFKVVDLPNQAVDYASTWADHWRSEGKSAELAAAEYSAYVNAFRAVNNGDLELPGIDDGEEFYKEVMNWIHKQFMQYNRSRPDGNNPNHKAFYAFLHRQAAENIRQGTFNEIAPNPDAAIVLERFVNESIVGNTIREMG